MPNPRKFIVPMLLILAPLMAACSNDEQITPNGVVETTDNTVTDCPPIVEDGEKDCNDSVLSQADNDPGDPSDLVNPPLDTIAD